METKFSVAICALFTCAVASIAFAANSNTKIIEADGVRLEYADQVPEQDVIYALGQAVYARTVVPRLVHRPAPLVLNVEMVDAERIPFTDENGTIWVPYGRLKHREPGVDPLSLTHETTHVVVPGTRDNRLLTEGLAVYVQTVMGPKGYPNFGVDLRCRTVQLQTKVGHQVALLDSETVRMHSDHGDDRELAYTQEGSFAQWLVETYGMDKTVALVANTNTKEPFGSNWKTLESEWRKAMATMTNDALCGVNL